MGDFCFFEENLYNLLIRLKTTNRKKVTLCHNKNGTNKERIMCKKEMEDYNEKV